MRDRFGREITSLRISITDRCNLRCRYCMPASGNGFLPARDALSAEEVVRIAQAAARTGIRKFRITGGEPLVRPDALEILARIRALPGAERLALSTNAVLLLERLPALKEIGLDGLNVSLDTLDTGQFERITRGGDLGRVTAAIWEALRIGIPTVKLNAVLLAGLNGDQAEPLASLSIENPLHVRFIEYMPHGEWPEPEQYDGIPAIETRERLKARFGLEPSPDPPEGAGPAEYWRIPGALGTVGFIHPYSDKFCARCNRIRLTSDGRVKGCLLREEFSDLKGLLRRGASDDDLARAISLAIWNKPEKHLDARAFTMNSIGG